MMARFFLSASLTGMFCSGFALLIRYVIDMLGQRQVVFYSFISGFLGSLAAQTVMGRACTGRQ